MFYQGTILSEDKRVGDKRVGDKTRGGQTQNAWERVGDRRKVPDELSAPGYAMETPHL
jgi:hypothetical protein